METNELRKQLRVEETNMHVKVDCPVCGESNGSKGTVIVTLNGQPAICVRCLLNFFPDIHMYVEQAEDYLSRHYDHFESIGDYYGAARKIADGINKLIK